MKRRFTLLAAVLAAVLLVPGHALADDEHAVHYYVALGDSLATGFQPNGQGMCCDTDDGYVDQLYATLRAGDPKLELVKLGCGGETTSSMIDGNLPHEGRGERYHCNYPQGSQLAEAVSFLAAHRQFISL